LEESIGEALARIGRFTGADRAYVFLFREDGGVMDNTHEWCAEGVLPQIDHLKGMPSSIFPWWMEQLRAFRTIVAPRVKHIPDAGEAERTILMAQQVRSVLVAPLDYQRKLLGFIGLDAVKEERDWTAETVHLLTTVGVAMVHAMELRNTHVGLVEARKEVIRAGRARSLFMVKMSHEIRTPLNAILGHVQLMQRAPDSAQIQTQGCDVIMKSGERLLRLLEDVMTVTRTGPAEILLWPAMFTTGRMIERIRAAFQARFEAKGLAFTIECGKAIPAYLYAAEGKLFQILSNLLENALEYTCKGSVRLSFDVCDAPEASAEGGQARATLVAEVADTGCGIDPERWEAIFDPFEPDRDPSGTPNDQGHGLGLAISRQLARIMDGDLSVRKNPGGGSRFALQVQGGIPSPDMLVETRPRRISRLNRPDDTPPPRLLVVDNDPTNRSMLCGLLATAGFEVVHAESGEEASRVLEQTRVAAVLLDKRMPFPGGMDTLRHVKEQPRLQGTKVIIITACGFSDDRSMMIKEGADGFVAEPVVVDELLGEIARTLALEYHFEEGVGEHCPDEPQESAVAMLSQEEREAFLKAVRRGDSAALRDFAGRIQVRSPQTGRHLVQWVEHYDYERIEEWLQ